VILQLPTMGGFVDGWRVAAADPDGGFADGV